MAEAHTVQINRGNGGSSNESDELLKAALTEFVHSINYHNQHRPEADVSHSFPIPLHFLGPP
jgi:hypothetical protein